MAGVKGRSGRRSLSDSQKRYRIIDKAWTIIEQQLDNPELSITTKIEIASKLVVRDVPSEVRADVESSVTMMPTITAGDKPLEFDLGTITTAANTELSGEATTDNPPPE